MKLLNKVKKTLNSTKASFKRFPFSIVSIFLSAIFFIMVIDVEFSIDSDIGTLSYTKYGFLFLIASVSTVALKLFIESLSGSAKTKEDIEKYRLYKIFGYIVNILMLYGIYDKILFSEKEIFVYNNGISYVGLFLFFIICCFFIAKLFYHKDYVAYVINIIRSLMISLLYSIVFFMGISAIYYAIVHLFGIKVEGYFYLKVAVLIFLPFNLSVFLSDFPNYSKTFDNYVLPRVAKILCEYILIPLFSIYGIILYIYFLKIIILMEIPRNLISNLVLWYGLLSVGLLFFISSIKDSIIVDKFRKLFPYAVIPLLIVLFYSIGLRIKEYGFTQNRYFVLMGGIYILFSMLYYIFYRNNSNITIPIMLNILIIISVIGPLSAYSLSLNSQNMKLKNILVKNEMLNGNEIIKKQDIPQDDRRRILKIVEYMTKNYRPYEIKLLPSDFVYDNKNFESLFGFKVDYDSSLDSSNIYNFEYNVPIDVSGYDEMMFFDIYPDSENLTVGMYKASITKDGIISICREKNSGSEEILSFKSSDIFSKLRAIRGSKGQVDIEDLSIEGNKNGIEYKILFTNIYDYSQQKNKLDFTISFYLLINKK